MPRAIYLLSLTRHRFVGEALLGLILRKTVHLCQQMSQLVLFPLRSLALRPGSRQSPDSGSLEQDAQR
jgi:hypothetical protein